MTRQLEEVLGHGVRVWLTPPPFEHTKLMVVDEEWVLFGSANWDARSLRLNFELGRRMLRQRAGALAAGGGSAPQGCARGSCSPRN